MRDYLVPLVAALLGGGAVAAVRSLFTLGPERGRTLAEEEQLAVTTLRQVIGELRELRAGDLAELARLRGVITHLEAELREAADLAELVRLRGVIAHLEAELARERALPHEGTPAHE